jgi:hypothetical protein
MTKEEYKAFLDLHNAAQAIATATQVALDDYEDDETSEADEAPFVIDTSPAKAAELLRCILAADKFLGLYCDCGQPVTQDSCPKCGTWHGRPYE